MVSPRTRSLLQYGVLALGLLAYGIVGVAAIAYPYDLGMYEGVVFAPALRLFQGEATFGPEAALTPPYNFPLYGPLYYAGLGALLKITGVAFWPGRLVSFVCGLGLAGLVFRHGRRVGLGTQESLLLANVFLMVPSAWTFFTIQRVDSPSLLLAGLGSVLMIERRGPRAALLGGVLFALAALTKPAVCGLFFGSLAFRVFERRRIEAGLCALSACVTFFGFVEGLRALGFGNYFFNLFASLDGSTSVASVEEVLRSVGGSPVFFILVTFSLLDLIGRGRRRSGDAAGPICLVLATFATGAILAAHTGSSTNYLLEMFFALCLVVASSLGSGALSRDPAAKGLAEVLLVAAFATESIVFHGGFIRGRFLIPLSMAPTFQAIARELSKLPAGSAVVGDLPDMVLRAGLRPWVNDVPQYTLGPAYVQAELKRALSDETVTAVLTYGRFDEPGFVSSPLPIRTEDSLGRIPVSQGPHLAIRALPARDPAR